MKRSQKPHSPSALRPRLDLLENSFDFVRDCVTECWAETPEDRPDFKVIRTRLRPLRKGMKPNIFDNMIAMMEKYANNLDIGKGLHFEVHMSEICVTYAESEDLSIPNYP
ncbi:guanylate cyclase 32E-like [Diaphorina citri]|uniref:Guanylate cyclase 32E-like n=1 Tax=Diaphorina citri TaxID=121845 RepID=A0A3Q0IMW8_DIACI|nr:guanylate cyclase 32E-like [Diaphorina citri]